MSFFDGSEVLLMWIRVLLIGSIVFDWLEVECLTAYWLEVELSLIGSSVLGDWCDWQEAII